MTNIDLGKTFLVEECDKIEVSNLLREYRVKLKEYFLRSKFEITDVEIRLTTSKTGNCGTRFWFVCPQCEKRVGVLFKHPILSLVGCRQCLNLEYRKRRFKGMLENKVI